ncbi:unnamed protein product [Arabidopsis halleri]
MVELSMIEGKAHRTTTPSVSACTTIPQHYIGRRKITEGHNDVEANHTHLTPLSTLSSHQLRRSVARAMGDKRTRKPSLNLDLIFEKEEEAKSEALKPTSSQNRCYFHHY